MEGKCKYLNQSIAGFVKKISKLTSSDRTLLERLNISVITPRPACLKAIKWTRPPRGSFKLNVDGSSLENPSMAGGGGILRDADGKLVFAFSRFFGTCSNDATEIRAVLEGLKICKQLGYNCIDIEGDSKVVVN